MYHEHKKTRSAHRGMHTKRHHDSADDHSREIFSLETNATGTNNSERQAWATAVYTSTNNTQMGHALEDAFVLDETFQHLNSNSCVEPFVVPCANAHSPVQIQHGIDVDCDKSNDHTCVRTPGSALQADTDDSSAYCLEGDTLMGLNSTHLNNDHACAQQGQESSTRIRYYTMIAPSESCSTLNNNINMLSLHRGILPGDDCSGDAPTGPEQVNFHEGPSTLTSPDSWIFAHSEPTCVAPGEGCFTAEPGTCHLGKRVAEESLKEKELLERLGDLKIRIAASVRGERGSGKRSKTAMEGNVGAA